MPLHCVRQVFGLLPGLIVESTRKGMADVGRYQAGKIIPSHSLTHVRAIAVHKKSATPVSVTDTGGTIYLII
jgi:hypothetical protein